MARKVSEEQARNKIMEYNAKLERLKVDIENRNKTDILALNRLELDIAHWTHYISMLSVHQKEHKF